MSSLFSGPVLAAVDSGDDILPSGLGISDNDSFNSTDLLATSIQGIFDKNCGGYCIIGACAHFNIKISWTGSIKFYTIISPKLKHPFPDLLVSSYNHAGDEPFAEWKATFGSVMKSVATSLSVAGGRPDPTMLDHHQSASFKEVDIIGHPLTIMPSLVSRNGTVSSYGPANSLTKPADFNPPNLDGSASSLSDITGDSTGDGFSDINIKEVIQSSLDGAAGSAVSLIADQYQTALLTLQAISIINDVKEMADYFKSIATLMDGISAITQTTVQSTFYANFVNPQFKSPRLFCPTTVKPLQPYYLSFADFFWWRSGFPVTDGPFSGDNHVSTILNPFSSDTLPVGANPFNPLAEVWGHKYPREGMLNQSHDAKTASVIAWRGMDVLQNSLPGQRIGLPLPNPKSESGFSIGNPKWQMIYPEVKSCESTPYYSSGSVLNDFMSPNEFGSYAWNYYRTYSCCSNTKGKHIATVNFPFPLCITLGEIQSDAAAKAEAQNNW